MTKVTHKLYNQDDQFRSSVETDRCREAVPDTGMLAIRSHQCNRSPKVFEDVELRDGSIENMGFCKIHSLEYQQKKDDAYWIKAHREDRITSIGWRLRDISYNTMQLLTDPQFDQSDIPEDIKHWVDEYKNLIEEREKLNKQ